MLYVDTPTPQEFDALCAERADACVSIYVQTTPLTQDIEKARIAFGNQAKQALEQLSSSGFDKRRLSAIGQLMDDLDDDDAFWRVQAHALAVFVTADRIRTFRLATKVEPLVEVSDRFHLKPLMRSITFADAGFVLALAENSVRLVEVFPDLPAQEIALPDLPKSAADALNVATLNDRSHRRRIAGSEGQKVRLAQYARIVDAAIRPILAGRDLPLIIAATEPLASIYRSVNSFPNLLDQTITSTDDRSSEGELAEAARPILDEAHREEVAQFHNRFEERAGDGRATTDISDAARAATFGAIEVLLVDMDASLPGTVDETTGAVSFADSADASNYGVVDEIMRRAIRTGARVLSVRAGDLPDGAQLAAVLRFKL